jgi:hypothetical protein
MEQGGSIDQKDTVTMNIPLLIRTLELSREDIHSDAELHYVVERLLDLKNKPVLTMDDYEYIADIEHKHIKKMELGGGVENQKIGLDDKQGILSSREKYDDFVVNLYYYNVGKIAYATKDFYPLGLNKISKGQPYLIIGDGKVTKKEYDDNFPNETKLLVKIGSDFYNSAYFDIVILENKLSKMELGGNVEDNDFEKLLSQAHTNLTVKMGRPEYAPNKDELQEEIDKIIMEKQFGSNNI